MRAIGTIDIGLIGLNLTVVLPMTGTLTIGGAGAGGSLTVVLPMTGTLLMIGGAGAGPSLIALPPMAGTPMIGKGAAVTVPLGNRGKIPGKTTKHCLEYQHRSLWPAVP